MTTQRYWMPTSKLKALAKAGWLYGEIADENERVTGWRPDRGTVSRRLQQLGVSRRHGSRRDLLPWHIMPEHNNSRWRAMLQAESRHRAGENLSSTAQKNRAMLNDILFGRGTPLVVGYDPAIGFYLVDKTDDDKDIIRYRPGG